MKMRNTDNWGARAREPYERVYGAAEFKDMWASWIDCFLTYIGKNQKVYFPFNLNERRAKRGCLPNRAAER